MNLSTQFLKYSNICSGGAKGGREGKPEQLVPFLITGCTRSGTTLLRRILHTHSRLAVFPESNFYTVFRHRLKYYGDLQVEQNLSQLLHDLRDFCRLKKVNLPPPNAFREYIEQPTFEGVYRGLLHFYARRKGKPQAGDKSPKHRIYLNEIQEKLPNSPILFCIRDPRDCVYSMRRAFAVSVDGAIHSWMGAYQSYQQSANCVYLLRYETLVQDPEIELRRLCGLLEVGYEPAMLRFHEREPVDFLPEHYRKTLQPIDPDSIGRFREMTPEDIHRVESICWKAMQDFGYQFDSVPDKKMRHRYGPLRRTADRIRYYVGSSLVHRRRRRQLMLTSRSYLRVRFRHWKPTASKPQDN